MGPITSLKAEGRTDKDGVMQVCLAVILHSYAAMRLVWGEGVEGLWDLHLETAREAPQMAAGTPDFDLSSNR